MKTLPFTAHHKEVESVTDSLTKFCLIIILSF